MDLVCSGLKTEEIARRRGVQPRTIRAQRESAYRKLGARNGVHAAVLWLTREAA